MRIEDKVSKRHSQLALARQALLNKPLRSEFGGKAKAGAIPRRQIPSIVPLSFAQQRLWFLDQLEPNNPFYNMPQAMRLRGVLDTRALARTIEAIISRHESLRTSFKSVDG